MTDYEQTSQLPKNQFLIYQNVDAPTRQALESITDQTRIPTLYDQLIQNIPDMLFPRLETPYPTSK